MATREPFPHDKLVEELARTFRDVQRTLAAQIQSAISQGRLEYAAERRMQYAAVLATLDRLGAQTDPLAAKAVADAYKEGAGKAGAQISQQAGFAVSVPYSFTGVQQDAIEALQREVVDRLGISRRMVGRSVDDLYAKAGRRATVRALLGADGSPQIAARRLKADLLREPYVKRLIENGGTGFVDRAGKKWSLQSYSEMVVRTTTRKAVVEGQIAKMASLGVNLARVSTHASACPICVPKQGRLVSLDGSTSDYNGEAVADLSSVGAPPYHPNCRHTLQPVVADIEALRREMQGSPPSQPVTISKPKLPKPTPATTSVARAADKPAAVPEFKSKAEAVRWTEENVADAASFGASDIEAIRSAVGGIVDVMGTNTKTLHLTRISAGRIKDEITHAVYRYPRRQVRDAAGKRELVPTGAPGEIRFKIEEMLSLDRQRKFYERNYADYLSRRTSRLEQWRELGQKPESRAAWPEREISQIEAATRWAVTQTSKDPIRANARHEAAHGLMYQTQGLKAFWEEQVADIPYIDHFRVSHYAAVTTDELWAEVTSAVLEGDTIPPKLLKAYKATMKRFGYATV